MSGYQALRASDRDGSRTSRCDSPGRHRDEPSAPRVLARVAVFNPEADRPRDRSRRESHDARPAPRAVPRFVVGSVARSRLAIGGLVLAGGLFGFVLGRATSPAPLEDPAAWSPAMPAPSAPEAPTWQSQSPPPAQMPWTTEPRPSNDGPTAGRNAPAVATNPSASTPWVPAAASVPSLPTTPAEPVWNQPPSSQPSGPTDRAANQQAASPQGQPPAERPAWPQEVDRPMQTDRPSQWGTNHRMALPETRPTGQQKRRPVENDLYDAARVASRPTMAGQPSVQPKVSSNAQPPVGGGSSSAGGHAASGATTGGSNYPNMNYPSTGYLADYPRANSVGEPRPQGNVPVEGASSQQPPLYTYPN